MRVLTFRRQEEPPSPTYAMEGSYPMHPAQAMGQSPFFYYNPDPTGENARQHGHFTPHPSGQSTQTFQPQNQDAFCPPNMLFKRPSSANSQIQTAYANHMLTPVASPQPMYTKPTILIQEQNSPYLHPIDTDFSDMRYAPATPPLSSSGSNISSPPSTCEFLPTPVNGAFFHGEGIEGVKQGCEEEVFSEILAAGADFRSTSPPMTPGKRYSIRFFLARRDRAPSSSSYNKFIFVVDSEFVGAAVTDFLDSVYPATFG